MVVALAVVFAPRAAVAEALAFQIGDAASAQTATVDTFSRDGVSYVSLGSLVKQVGGSVTTSGRSVQVEFGDKGAMLTFGDTAVSGTQAQVTLNKPILESDGEAYMAVDDVIPFIAKAFQTKVARFKASALVPDENSAAEAALTNPAPTDPAAPVDQTASAGPVVIIDPGHGGGDTGIQGQSQQEKDVALALAQQLKKAIESSGTAVVLTRNADVAVPPLSRINLAIENKGRLLISLHTGASYSVQATGYNIYYASDSPDGQIAATGVSDVVKSVERSRTARQSKDFAAAVARALGEDTTNHLRGVHAVRSYLLSHVPMPGLIIEAGILTTPSDETLLRDPAYMDRFAQGVATAVREQLAVPADSKAAP